MGTGCARCFLIVVLLSAAVRPQAAFVPTAIPSVGQVVWAVADLNGDGAPDLVTCDPGAGSPCVRLANGPLSWVPVPGSIGIAQIVATGDVNGDGFVDLVGVLGPYSGFIATVLGDGQGRFSAPMVSNLTVCGAATPGTLAELTGDGIPDLVTSTRNPPCSGSAVLQYTAGRGTGTGVFIPIFLPPGLPALTAVPKPIDADNDGDTDLFFPGSSGPVLLFGNGSGTFVAGPTIVLSPPATRAATVRDVDGDGVPDIVYAIPFGTTGASGVAVARGLPGGVFAPTWTRTFRNGPLSVALGTLTPDLDTDGLPDIVVVGGAYGLAPAVNVAVLFGTSTGPGPDRVFVESWAAPDLRYVHLADIEVDGDLDVLVPRAAGATTSLVAWRNLHAGSHPAAVGFYSAGTTPGPALTLAGGAPVPGSSVTLAVANGAPLAAAVLAIGSAPSMIDLGAGCFLGVAPAGPSGPALVLPHVLGGAGQASFTFPVPAGAGLSGVRVYIQEFSAGPAPIGGLRGSDGLMFVIG